MLIVHKAKALGRQQLGKIETIAQAETILRWHRELIQPEGKCKANKSVTRDKPKAIISLAMDS